MAIGYACITIGVQNTGLSRCTLKNATGESLRKITASNLTALEAMVDYNIKNGIGLFRISSDIIPFGSHPVNQIPWQKEFSEQLSSIGQKIASAGMRVSMHPGQYTVLNAPDPRVLHNAMKDLRYHGAFLDALGADMTNKIVLHIGGVYGDKGKSATGFINNCISLPQSIRNRLVIENDERNYNISEVLAISKETGLPVVFDNLHHRINPPEQDLPDCKWVEICGETWKGHDGRQKIHYSQQKAGAIPGAHSDTIFVNGFQEFYNSLNNHEVDIMLEVKDKNLSAMKCINMVMLDVPAGRLEGEWERYKYFVLARSAELYDEIRQILKEKGALIAKELYEKIEQAFLLPGNKGAEINAAQHVWGYIGKDCISAERKRYEKLLKAFTEDAGTVKPLKNHLLKCAQVRDLEYLIDSLYFYL